MKGLKLPDGRDRLVRHGHGPERTIQTGIGPVEVERVKIRDRAAAEDGERIRFTSAILPLWSRRTIELGHAFAGALLAGHFDGRLPGGAGRASGPERTELVNCYFPANGRVAGLSTSAGRSAIRRRTNRSTLGRLLSFCRPA